MERPCNPCSSILIFVISSRSSSENIIISLTLTAQLVGFISSHWFLTHGVLYIQTDGSSLLPNPPLPHSPLSFYMASFDPTNLTLQAPTWKKEDGDKNTLYWLSFLYAVLSLWPCQVSVLLPTQRVALWTFWYFFLYRDGAQHMFM